MLTYFLGDNIWSENFLFYHKTCFSRKTWVYSIATLFWKIAYYLSRSSRALKFSHIVALESCVTTAYSEPCHIQNSGIFRILEIFRTLSRNILADSGRCVMLRYWELCHIQNFGIFRTQGIYLESCLYGYI